MTLTPRQRDTLAALRQWLIEHGQSPTLEELGDVLGICKVSVLENLWQLRAKGYVNWTPRRARTLRIVGERCPLCGHEPTKEKRC